MTSPASPRVAEELLKECAEELALALDLTFAGLNGCTQQRFISGATAIITLAQNAVLREVAEWCEARASRRSENAESWARTGDDIVAEGCRGEEQAYQDAAGKIRAMMVKP